MLYNRRRTVAIAIDRGFSLPELLVVIVIIGVTAAVGIPAFFFLVQRARIQSVALEAAGWLENVRNAAADEINPIDNQGGCVVTFTPAGGMAAGDSLATVDPNCTLPENELLIPQAVQQDTVTVAGPETIVFTPRGLWTDAQGNLGQNFQLDMTLDGGGPLRCIRLSPTLGSVEIGRPAGGAGCQNWQQL